MNNYDVVIVGAGIMGSAAAYYLSKAGQKVLLLEQYTLEHQKGSSHDISRITRYAYDHPAYVELAKVNFPLWAAFEEAAGETFYTRTGGIDFGRPEEPYLRDLQTTLTQTGIPFETLTPEEATKRFPQFHIPDDMIVIYQADSGVLAATPAVLAHVRLAQQHGATVLAETPVMRIVPTGDGVTVHTPRENYAAARVIVSAGAWTAPLMAELGLPLPLVPTRVQVAYFHTASPADYVPECFPVFIAHVAGTFTEHAPYGLPDLDGSGLKIGIHGGEGVASAGEINYEPDERAVSQIGNFMQAFLPGAKAKLNKARVCVYTMTPDHHFIIDRHPQYPQIVVASPCSGHGFKFGTLIGSILSDLALNGTTEHDISLFSLNRFPVLQS